MKKNKLHIIWAIVAIAALAGGYFWGANTASVATIRGGGRFGFSSSTGGFGSRGGFGGGSGGFTIGQVLSVDANSLMLQLQNGNSENVYFSSTTQIIVPQPSSIASIKSGFMVMIGGTQNSDGSVTATTIQVRGASSVGQTQGQFRP